MNIESWRLENCPERELKYVTFAYSSGSINPPVNTVNGEYQVIDESVRPHEKLYMRWNSSIRRWRPMIPSKTTANGK